MLDWLLQAVAGDAPPPDALTPAELDALGRLRLPKRRREWLAGRLCAKTLLARCLSPGPTPLPLRAVEVDAAPSGAPRARLAPDAAPVAGSAPGAALPACLSISHSHGIALAALLRADPREGWRLGCDVERVEARSAAFSADHLTGAERAHVAADPTRAALLTTAIWSAKESVLKALGVGLRADTRRLSCRLGIPPPPGRWAAFEVETDLLEPGARLAGSWRRAGQWVLSLAVLSRAGAPFPQPAPDPALAPEPPVGEALETARAANPVHDVHRTRPAGTRAPGGGPRPGRPPTAAVAAPERSEEEEG